MTRAAIWTLVVIGIAVLALGVLPMIGGGKWWR